MNSKLNDLIISNKKKFLDKSDKDIYIISLLSYFIKKNN